MVAPFEAKATLKENMVFEGIVLSEVANCCKLIDQKKLFNTSQTDHISSLKKMQSTVA